MSWRSSRSFTGTLLVSSTETFMAETLKRTPLFSAHALLHAKFGPFGGWELPIYYSSILQEHQAVRTAVGVFDVSHLAHLEIAGAQVESQLQPLFTQDLTRLAAGRAIYSPMLTPEGAILDEMIIYRLAADRFRLVVNAANGDKVLAWVAGHLKAPVAAQDFRRKFGTLAVQGPKAVGLVERLAGEPLAQVPRYSVRSGTVAGKPALFARTGYTGEDGFELFVAVEELEFVWNTLLKSSQPDGIRPIGLGARDTLRLEAGLPLGGTDLDEKTTPLEAGLDWTIAWDKGFFIGREVLERQRQQGIARRLVGFRLKGAGIPRTGYPIFWQGRQAGRVTSGTFLPTMNQAIGMGYVPPGAAGPGTAITVQIHGHEVSAEVVKLPFYRRAK